MTRASHSDSGHGLKAHTLAGDRSASGRFKRGPLIIQWNGWKWKEIETLLLVVHFKAWKYTIDDENSALLLLFSNPLVPFLVHSLYLSPHQFCWKTWSICLHSLFSFLLFISIILNSHRVLSIYPIESPVLGTEHAAFYLYEEKWFTITLHIGTAHPKKGIIHLHFVFHTNVITWWWTFIAPAEEWGKEDCRTRPPQSHQGFKPSAIWHQTLCW